MSLSVRFGAAPLCLAAVVLGCGFTLAQATEPAASSYAWQKSASWQEPAPLWRSEAPAAFWDRLAHKLGVTIDHGETASPTGGWSLVIADENQALHWSWAAPADPTPADVSAFRLQSVHLTGQLQVGFAHQTGAVTWILGYRTENLDLYREDLEMGHWAVMVTTRF